MSIELKKVEAMQFRKILNSGRTSPCLFDCKDVVTNQLKGRTLNLERITRGIKSMNDGFLMDIQASIPNEWRDDKIDQFFKWTI